MIILTITTAQCLTRASWNVFMKGHKLWAERVFTWADTQPMNSPRSFFSFENESNLLRRDFLRLRISVRRKKIRTSHRGWSCWWHSSLCERLGLNSVYSGVSFIYAACLYIQYVRFHEGSLQTFVLLNLIISSFSLKHVYDLFLVPLFLLPIIFSS